MTEYPEPNDPILDMMEIIIAMLLVVALYFAVYFAANIGGW